MQPKAAGSFAGGYQFLFAGLPENVEYYVTAGAMTSKHFNIRVTDLPAVKQIRVTYHYPAWTGMPSEIEERGGDLRAVTGTEAELDVSTDRPLARRPDPARQRPARSSSPAARITSITARVKMDRDGVYHVAGIEQGQPVRVSEDFFIEARKANPPQISLVRPGRGDYHASPIEEVTVAAKATDEYGLNGVALHYSVNGGPETTVDLLHQKGEKQADGSTTLSLENFKLVPGDLVSVYATAKDGNAEAHTDMMFIQADPFEREFSQSQVGRAAVAEAAEEGAIRRPRFRSAKRKSSPRPSSSRATRTPPRSRPPTSPSCCPNPNPLCAIRPSRFPAAWRLAS